MCKRNGRRAVGDRVAGVSRLLAAVLLAAALVVPPGVLAADGTDAGDEPASRDALFGDEAPGAPQGVTGTPASAPASPWHGFTQFELARTVAAPAHWSRMLGRADVSRQGSAGEGIKWKIGARVDYDAVYGVSHYYPPEVARDQRFNVMLRENYLDVGAGDWDFRLGRQHVVWGEMVGLFFADVVSALDTREYILPDFDVQRIPQWAARAEYFKDDFHAELLWIPIPSYDEIGKPGAEFFPAAPPPPAGYATEYRNEVRPVASLRNTNYGLRLSLVRSGWDFSGFYYRSMDAAPTFYREIVAAPQSFVYEARHDRIEQAGGTIAKDFGPFVLKGEAVHTRGRGFNVTRLTDSDGVVRQNTLDWAVGLDFAFPSETRLNLQLFQRAFFGHDPDILYDRHENGGSILLNVKLGGHLEAEGLLIASFNRADWLFRPKLVWKFSPAWNATFGVDVFEGPPLGMFGRFDNRDRVYVELRHAF